MVTGSALRVGEGVMWASSCLEFSFPLPVVSNICYLLSDKGDWFAWMWWIKYFFFQECHGPESFRFEGLELPYLKKWTARHRLCQPLQCPEEQWGQKYVWGRGGWCGSFMWVGRRIRRHGFLSAGPINLMMPFPPERGAAVTLLPLDAVWSFRRAEHFFLPAEFSPFSLGL